MLFEVPDSLNGFDALCHLVSEQFADSRSVELPPTLFVHRPPVPTGRRLGQEIEVRQRQ